MSDFFYSVLVIVVASTIMILVKFYWRDPQKKKKEEAHNRKNKIKEESKELSIKAKRIFRAKNENTRQARFDDLKNFIEDTEDELKEYASAVLHMAESYLLNPEEKEREYLKKTIDVFTDKFSYHWE